MSSDLVIVHSSDIHITDSRSGDGLHSLSHVIRTAEASRAHLLLLAGDTFDHNRLPASILGRAVETLASAQMPIVVLPGNHDCLADNSVFLRGVAEPENVTVLGIDGDEAVRFPDLELEIWGRPHLDYADMSPLTGVPPRTMRRRIVTAHGHWVRESKDRMRSWLIHDEEAYAVDADYVALGHWPQCEKVGDGRVPAYYSGAPDLAKSVNLVRIRADGALQVDREPIR